MRGRVTEDRKSEPGVTVSAPNSDGLVDRVRQVIGSSSARSFAIRHGIKPSTLQSILEGRRPIIDNLVAVARAGGVNVDWLATGEGPMCPGEAPQEQFPSVTTYTGELPDGFVLVPRYDVSASAGPGALADGELVVDHMAFRADFVRRVLRADPAHLALITAIGDSMDPAIRAGDLLLIDTAVDRIIDDAIYVLQVDGSLRIKRVQSFMDGRLALKSDNPAYEDETLEPRNAGTLRVAGRLRWIGRLI